MVFNRLFCGIIGILLSFSIFNILKGQALFEIKQPHLHYAFNKIEGTKTAFKTKEEYRFYGIELFPDSTFIYYYVSNPLFDMAAGKYVFHNKNIISFMWDSLKTQDLIKDSSIWRHYFKFKKPVAYKVPYSTYLMNEKGLESLTLKYEKMELIASSGDFYKKSQQLDSFKLVNYSDNLTKDTLKISYGLNKILRIKKNEIWGFRIFSYGNYKVYRVEPKPMNWYSYPALQIIHIEDGFVIYKIGGNGNTFYYYFSKGPDSEIYPLNYKEIKKAYANNTFFIYKLNNEVEWTKRYLAIDKETNNMKIFDIYRESINKK